MLGEFYAVTGTSIYRVTSCPAPNFASAVKIAGRGQDNKVSVGTDIVKPGLMLAVGRWLQAYIPERYGMEHPLTAEERRLEQVNTQWWDGHSSAIVALFFTEAEARACFDVAPREPCSPRWIESTKKVLDAIGDEHPSFYLPTAADLRLIPLASVS